MTGPEPATGPEPNAADPAAGPAPGAADPAAGPAPGAVDPAAGSAPGVVDPATGLAHDAVDRSAGPAHDAAGEATGPVPPGSGWPGDPATPSTPVAYDAAQVRDLAAGAGTLAELVARQSVCRACPRLVEWREQVASVKRRSLRAERYWGRPVPGWGSEQPRVLILGLAPAAHGGNRTGRIFTGDRSGDVLFASLFRCGLAAAPESTAAGDGQRLIGTRMAAAVRCVPPLNKPSVVERDTCAPWLSVEIGKVITYVRVIVCLGGFAWQALWPALRSVGIAVPRPRPQFGHGAEVSLTFPGGVGARERVLVIGCYHPSQQNTFTGRVTPGMLDEIFLRSSRAAGLTDEPECSR
jgi:uracil-DNA glycosylase family 4